MRSDGAADFASMLLRFRPPLEIPDEATVSWRSRREAEDAFCRSSAKAEAELLYQRIHDEKDSQELADAASSLSYHLRETQAAAVLVLWCCEVLPAGPLVRGRLLRDVWVSGAIGSILKRAFSAIRILSWFREASPLTLMTEAERMVLNSLPDPVEAYRGGRGLTLAKAAAGVSWTLDISKAETFAKKHQLIWGQGAVVRGQVPRDAIVAYIDGRDEKELVVSWRRVRKKVLSRPAA